jgi:hypothetical protein
VALHYNYKVEGEEDRPSRSLETKWGDIKATIAKFTSCYWAIKDLMRVAKPKVILLWMLWIFTSKNVEGLCF